LTPVFVIILIAAWLVFALFCRWISVGVPRPGVLSIGLFFRFIQVYARLVHRLEVRGREHAEQCDREVGPLVVVCNHTAGVDPALVQSAMVREVRWMMAKDMMLADYAWAWEWLRIIAVDTKARADTNSVRDAIRHLKEGGVLGLFPEGGIERPARQFRPFMAGAGLIIARTRAPVLPVFITGTPDVPQAWESLWTRSHASLTIGPVMRFPPTHGVEEINRDIRAWFERVSGWKTCEYAPAQVTDHAGG
jgi:1-acyl-sn-glycerol-3-phosphate acyltransferase